MVAWACEAWASEIVRGVDGQLEAEVVMLGVVGGCVMAWGAGSSGARGVGASRLVVLLGAFVFGMGVVMVSGDAVVLFVGWECIGVVSVLLVG